MAYRVLIVDDEKYICKFIENRTNWKELQLEVIGNARNGEEALKKMEMERPDIVLVDIRMPKMDGLTFIEEAKKRYCGVSYIIMSAYNDFTYAQQAIRLGVEDYLLKPVNTEVLEPLLKKIVYNKQEEILEQIMRGQMCEKNYFYGKEMMPIIFFSEENEENRQSIQSSLTKALNVYGKHKIVTFFCPRTVFLGECIIFLLNGDALDEIPIFQVVKAVWNDMPNLPHVASYVAAVEANWLGEAVQRAVELMKQRIFYSERQVLFSEKDGRKNANNYWATIQNEFMRICQDVSDRNYEKARESLRFLTEKCICSENSPQLIEDYIAEVVHFFEKLPDVKNEEKDFFILAHRLKTRNCLLRYESADEVKEDLLSLADRFLQEKAQKNESDAIGQIKEYIMNNYKENLTVVNIAQKFFLNPNYLSTLFKEKVGMNLKPYIEGIRMERAKEYLLLDYMSITEIAQESGYSDPNYFTKVFKKYMGITPKQFRESEQRMIS